MQITIRILFLLKVTAARCTYAVLPENTIVLFVFITKYIAKTPAEQLPNVSPHGLRHSVAALLISENVDARTVAGILGHANPTTTLNIYSYFFKSKGNQAAKIIEEKLVPTSLFLTR